MWKHQKWCKDGRKFKTDEFWGVIDKQAMDRYGSESTAAAGIQEAGFASSRRTSYPASARSASTASRSVCCSTTRTAATDHLRGSLPNLVRALKAINSQAPADPEDYADRSPLSHAIDALRFLIMKWPVRTAKPEDKTDIEGGALEPHPAQGEGRHRRRREDIHRLWRLNQGAYDRRGRARCDGPPRRGGRARGGAVRRGHGGPTERGEPRRLDDRGDAEGHRDQVPDAFERDKNSRAPRMKHLKEIQEMLCAGREEQGLPFHKAANVKTPSLTGPVLQIGARLFDMMWPISGKVFSVVGATAEDTQFSTVTSGSATPTFATTSRTCRRLHDTIHQMANYGSSFRRVYWNAYERKIRADWIPMEDFVVYAKVRSQDPSMADVPRYTMVHHMSKYDIEAYERDGIFINADKVKGTAEDHDASDFKKTSDKIDGYDIDEQDEDYPRQVLEQHCRWKLPKQPTRHPAFDGKEHYVVITLDRGSGQMLRMSLREEDDPE